MRTATRALRTLIRNPLRGALLIGVLAVSVGLALIMITVNGAFATRLDDIQSQVGTSVTVRPAGSFGGGFFGGDRQENAGGAGNGNGGTNGNANANPGSNADPNAAAGGDPASTAQPTVLADADVNKITALQHVVSVSGTTTVRYTGQGITSAIQRRGAIGAQGAPAGAANFTPPVMVTGIDDPSSLATLGVANAQLTAGRTFSDSESSANVAVLGQALADHNNLTVGSTFPLNGQTFQVIGIYATGTQFGDNALFVPLSSLQTVFNRPGEIDQAVVTADSSANVDQVANDIKTALGANNVDVITEQSIFQAISSPLSDAKDSSWLGMLAALGASAAVILFSVGLVARQRVKEIGILKAIGASNWHVIGQFGMETAAVSIVAGLLGALATFPLAQKVANGLLSSSSTPTGGGRRGQAAAAFAGRVGGLLGSVDVAVSPQVFLYALGIAIGLAVIAAVVPAWYVGRVRPAEVLRNE